MINESEKKIGSKPSRKKLSTNLFNHSAQLSQSGMRKKEEESPSPIKHQFRHRTSKVNLEIPSIKEIESSLDRREEKSYYLILRSKFNRYDRALEILKTSKTIPHEMRYFVANCSRSIFFSFFDKVFENMSDIDLPSLGNKERDENIEKQTDEYIIKKAMMKGTDQDDIKKSEITYLQSKYGNMVPDLSAYLNHNIISSIHMRHKLTMLFHKSLKDPNLKLVSFLKTILIIEYEINRYLLPEGSMFKMVFFNRSAKQHFVIKIDPNIGKNAGVYEIISFESAYLTNCNKIAKVSGQNYLGFDCLNFENKDYQANVASLKDRLSVLMKGYGDPTGEKNFEHRDLKKNIWTCLLNRVESDHIAFEDQGSQSESDCELDKEMEREMMKNENSLKGYASIHQEDIKEVSKEDYQSETISNSKAHTIDQVSLLTFYHFCEEADTDEGHGLIEKFKVIGEKMFHLKKKEESSKSKEKKEGNY